MKGLRLALLLLLVAAALSCQTVYQSPQTVGWNVPAGVGESELYLCRNTDDLADPINYTLMGSTTLTALLVDVDAAGLTGVFVVCIRTKTIVDGAEVFSDFAFSNNQTDVDPVFGTFLLISDYDLKPFYMRLE